PGAMRLPNAVRSSKRRSERLLGRALLVQAVLLEPPVEGLRRDLEQLDGAPPAALRGPERPEDVRLLGFLDHPPEGRRGSVLGRAGGHGGRGRPQVLGQVRRADRVAVHQAYGPLYDLLELADVEGPMV